MQTVSKNTALRILWYSCVPDLILREPMIDDTPRGGAASVGVTSQQSIGRDAQQFLHIVVTDTCPGIPPKICERMFEKFFRLEHHHADRANGARGAGIGLYLCRQIVEAHGRKIRCEPGDKGCGTRIAFRPRSST